MKSKRWAALLLAMSLMAAAPADQHFVRSPSLWSRFVAGAKRLLREPFERLAYPFGRTQDDYQYSDVDTAPRAGSVLSEAPAEQQATVRRDDAVQQATAIEPATEATRTAGKPPLFSRPKGRSRTASDYMSEEKP